MLPCRAASQRHSGGAALLRPSAARVASRRHRWLRCVKSVSPPSSGASSRQWRRRRPAVWHNMAPRMTPRARAGRSRLLQRQRAARAARAAPTATIATTTGICWRGGARGRRASSRGARRGRALPPSAQRRAGGRRQERRSGVAETRQGGGKARRDALRKPSRGRLGLVRGWPPDSRRPLPASPSRQALTLKDACSSGCGRVFLLDLGGGGEGIFYPRVGMAETADADTGAVVVRKKT